MADGGQKDDGRCEANAYSANVSNIVETEENYVKEMAKV